MKIKFRFWDKKAKVMMSWEQMTKIDWDCVPLWILNGDERYEIMQFTGLKARDNTEIYEGDLVKFQNQICKVIFFDGAYAIKSVDSKTSETGDFIFTILHTTHPDIEEVIGNIHEVA